MSRTKGSLNKKTALRVLRQIEMHRAGMSTAKIAKALDMKKNSVIGTLRYHGVLKPALGRDVELEVAAWSVKFARGCQRMPGDHSYDFRVNMRSGDERVDVKSAHVTDNNGYPSYKFSLEHRFNAGVIHDETDSYWLVFLNEPKRPVYRVRKADVSEKKTLSVPKNIQKSKYPLTLLGHLDGGGAA